MSNALVSHDLFQLPTETQLNALMKYGNLLVKSGLLPTSINSAEKAIVIILKGRELGIPPMLALSQICIINGKPAMQAELMISLVYKNVQGVKIDLVKSENDICIIKATRPGQEQMQFSFTYEEAKKANLLGKKSWIEYPKLMCRARTISHMCRFLFPDIILGLGYTPEELGDDNIQDMKDVNPIQVDPPNQKVIEPPKEVINEAPKQKEIDETIIETQKIKESFIYDEDKHKLEIFAQIKRFDVTLAELKKLVYIRQNKTFEKLSELSALELEDLLEQLKGGKNV